MNFVKSIYIMGQPYTIYLCEVNEIGNDTDGICATYEKKILLRYKKDLLTQDSEESAKTERYKEVIRHELVHAFFHESGVDTATCGNNEEFLAIWISRMMPIITIKTDLIYNAVEAYATSIKGGSTE